MYTFGFLTAALRGFGIACMHRDTLVLQFTARLPLTYVKCHQQQEAKGTCPAHVHDQIPPFTHCSKGSIPLSIFQADDKATAAVAAVSPAAPILGAKAKSKASAAAKEGPAKSAQSVSVLATETAATLAEPAVKPKAAAAKKAPKPTASAAAASAAAATDAPARGKGAKQSEKEVDSVALNRELDSLAPKVTTALAAAAAKQPAGRSKTPEQKRNPTPHGLHTEAAASSAEGNAKGGAKEAGVVYLGHIPFGFFEAEMRKFFAQFGTVLRIKLARNYKVCIFQNAHVHHDIFTPSAYHCIFVSLFLTISPSSFAIRPRVYRPHGRVITPSSSLRTRKWRRSSPRAWTVT